MTLELKNIFNSSQGAISWDVFGNGQPVVLVHGTPTSSHLWRNVMPRLANHYQVWVYDLAGYGRSDKFDGQDVRLRTQSKILGELIKSWEIEMPHLVGHDFGAATILGTHLIEKISVRSLTVIDGVVLSPWGTPYSLLVKENIDVFSAIPEYIHRAALEAHIRTAISRPINAEIVDPFVAPWLGQEGQKAYYRQVAQYDHDFTINLEKLYHSIDVPTRILWGEEDKWVDPAEGERLKAMIPDASLVPVPDAGHFAMEEVPGVIANELLDFWQSIGGA